VNSYINYLLYSLTVVKVARSSRGVMGWRRRCCCGIWHILCI